MAGVAVGESDLRHRVSEHLRPFRDVLLGLFFVTVGMQIDPKAIVASPLQAILWLALFVLAKPVLSVLGMRATGYGMMNSVRAAVVLAHASELTLLIVTQSISANLLPVNAAQATLVAAALSMGLAPVIIRHNRRIASRVLRVLWRLARLPHPSHGAGNKAPVRGAPESHPE